MVVDLELLEEVKKRLADKFTAAELVELMELPVEEIIEVYFDYIPGYILEELN